MELIKDLHDCCGCTACEFVCGHSAIQMLPDKEGFLYPEINQDLCVDCGLCKKVCTFQNGYDTPQNFEEPKAFAVRHKNLAELETSRSGGMFVAISDYVIENGGSVYGTGFTDGFRVIHKRAKSQLERNEFRGSKYVQSDLSDVFLQVKADLKAGLMVLFTSTPCHTSGLYAFLKNVNIEKLFVCDIICHGVPSPMIWNDYLSYIETKYKDQVTKVDFRDKECGWSAHSESFEFAKRKKIISQTYTHLFYQNIMLRPACEHCKYTNLRRPSDITLADFWGWEKVSTTFNADNKGVSLVFVNTPKGETIFNLISDKIEYIESSLEDCMQPNLLHPSKISPLRILFWADYQKKGFVFVAKKYGNLGMKSRVLELLITSVRLAKRIVKKLILR